VLRRLDAHEMSGIGRQNPALLVTVLIGQVTTLISPVTTARCPLTAAIGKDDRARRHK
jgi:hypothetical protein